MHGSLEMLPRLTPRERDVLERLVAGDSNKEAGIVLGISHRTVEVHRARIKEKFGARNTADLVRLVTAEDFLGPSRQSAQDEFVAMVRASGCPIGA